MVDHYHQDMHPGGRGQQPGAHRDLPRGQVEGFGRRPCHRGGQVLFCHRGDWQFPAQLVHPQDPLVRLPVGDREHGAQHLVPRDHVG